MTMINNVASLPPGPSKASIPRTGKVVIDTILTPAVAASIVTISSDTARLAIDRSLTSRADSASGRWLRAQTLVDELRSPAQVGRHAGTRLLSRRVLYRNLSRADIQRRLGPL